MARYYYQSIAGERVELRGRDVKRLAAEGMITPYTLIEYEDGRKCLAKEMVGLEFGSPQAAEAHFQEAEVASEIPSHPELPTSEKVGFTGRDIAFVIGGVCAGILFIGLILYVFCIWQPAVAKRAQERRERIAAEQLEREEQERQRIAAEKEQQRIAAQQVRERKAEQQAKLEKLQTEKDELVKKREQIVKNAEAMPETMFQLQDKVAEKYEEYLSYMDKFIKEIERKKDSIDRDSMTGRDDEGKTIGKILDLVGELLKGVGEIENEKKTVGQYARVLLGDMESMVDKIKFFQVDYDNIEKRIYEIDREIYEMSPNTEITEETNDPFDRFFTNVGGAFEEFGKGVGKAFSDAGQKINVQMRTGLLDVRLDNLKSIEKLHWRNIANINKQLQLKFHMHRKMIGMKYDEEVDKLFLILDIAIPLIVDSI